MQLLKLKFISPVLGAVKLQAVVSEPTLKIDVPFGSVAETAEPSLLLPQIVEDVGASERLKDAGLTVL
jgi:hypothetical protein